MQKLLATSNAAMMAELHAYLRQRGIPVTVSENGNQLELWLTQSSYKALAKELITEFKNNPQPLEPVESSSASQPTRSSANRTGPSIWRQMRSQAGAVTLGFAVLVVAVYLGLQTPAAEALFATLRISDYFDVLPWTQPWRLVTPALLHFSLLHILFNVFWWWYLGGRFEKLYGSVWLVLALLVTAIISNVSQFLVSGPYFGGLSGVVYGLFGCAVVLAWQRPSHPLFLPPGLIGFMLVWLVLGYTDLLWVNVANTAHTAGLIAGLVFGASMRLLALRKR
ncbi:rhomboid family intramembrane serine protease GlpG [Pseudidiomarina aestuarii]|uniref:Rhomboid family intramembrane serine protease GlpG n=1 Tax=Pseudidiomarina aestuarii TaxID=624146 RepID=A0A7Z6ZVB6_9GAMM|nr:rhomboid family intramembrane serine protease GlpG [Pseudidiomarina aestuarii]RUO41896.1 rhomboid family intramembrane serine protease GlpG [Pseudidiomarina aestuarii]